MLPTEVTLVPGQNITLKSLSIRELVPEEHFYMTYEGSMTIPGCFETITWIIINKVCIVRNICHCYYRVTVKSVKELLLTISNLSNLLLSFFFYSRFS